MKISPVIIIVLLIFIAFQSVALVYFIQRFKFTRRFRELLAQARFDYSAVKKRLFEEQNNVEKHREELMAQTEHLQEMNLKLERLSLVASKTDTAVLIADKNGNYIWANEGFVKQCGYTLTEYITNFGKDIYTSSSELNIRPMLDEAIRNRRSLSYSSRMRSKVGEQLWLKTLINPIFDEYGNVQQFIILDTDISELKLVNDKLKKLSLVASKTTNAVLIFDAKENLDWVNEGFYKMYGYTKSEFILKFSDSFDTICKAFIEEKQKKELLENKASATFVGTFTDRFGEHKWKQSTLTPVFDEREKLINYIVVEADITRVKEAETKLQEEKSKTDQLLLNILPEETAEELKSKGKATPRFYRSASVFFADIQDFTRLAENLTPDELVHALQSYFSRFDDTLNEFYIEKIKTMGDAFLGVGGIPMRNKSHPFDTVLAALTIQRIMRELGVEREEQGRKAWNLRVGIHTGPIVAGVVGKQKMTYDIWGDTVNIAKRIESACLPGMVNISGATFEHIKDYFICEHRGKILAKHKGHIDMYFVLRLRPEFSQNADGIVPNNYFQEMLSRL